MTVHRIARGLLYEDFADGQEFDHHWGRTFNEHDSIWYSNMTMQYNPLYFVEPYAKELGYKSIPIHPLWVFTTVLGLSVEDLSEAGGPFLGVDDMEILQPVYAGDTVRAHSVVTNRRTTDSRPGWGIVEWHTTGINQDGHTVLSFRRRNLSKMRSKPTPNTQPTEA